MTHEKLKTVFNHNDRISKTKNERNRLALTLQ